MPPRSGFASPLSKPTPMRQHSYTATSMPSITMNRQVRTSGFVIRQQCVPPVRRTLLPCRPCLRDGPCCQRSIILSCLPVTCTRRPQPPSAASYPRALTLLLPVFLPALPLSGSAGFSSGSFTSPTVVGGVVSAGLSSITSSTTGFIICCCFRASDDTHNERH